MFTTACRRFMRIAAVGSIALLPILSPANNEWPKTVSSGEGTITVFTPQIEQLQGDRVEGRMVLSATTGGGSQPLYGAAWFTCRADIDRDKETVTLSGLKVDKVKFHGGTEAQADNMTRLARAKLPAADMVIPLDTLLNQLQLVQEKEREEPELNNDPPAIKFTTKPSALIMIDGEPRLKKAEGSELMRVLNTPYFIVFAPATKDYYLKGGSKWYSAKEYTGPWALASAPPEAAVKLAASDYLTSAGAIEDDDVAPEIVVSTVPAELVQTSGEPEFVPIGGTNLLYAGNANKDWFMESGSKTNYLLLAGRWYKAQTTAGPWEYVASKDLPADFAKIPQDSAKAHVLASVAGTGEAEEAVANLDIPQTAAIKRDEAKLETTYDGEPKFEPIKDTGLSRAVNTPQSIVRASNGNYYCCQDGVWYSSSGASGPWVVADSVPNEIYSIPPSCPLYNVTYCRVYDSTPEYVYVGYTPGYTCSYYSGGSVVYGSGYCWPGWYDSWYYPYPATWGFGVHYNPWYRDWGCSIGWGPGWIGWGGGLYAGWFGPYGWCDYDIDIDIHHHSGWHHGWHHKHHGHHGYHGHRGDGHRDLLDRPHTRPRGNNVYAKRDGMKRDDFRRKGDQPGRERPEWKDKIARAAAEKGRIPGMRDKLTPTERRDGVMQKLEGLRAQKSAAQELRGRGTNADRLQARAANRQDNLIADRNGNVFRKTGDGWQKRDGDNWAAATRRDLRGEVGTRKGGEQIAMARTHIDGLGRVNVSDSRQNRASELRQLRDTRQGAALGNAARQNIQGTDKLVGSRNDLQIGRGDFANRTGGRNTPDIQREYNARTQSRAFDRAGQSKQLNLAKQNAQSGQRSGPAANYSPKRTQSSRGNGGASYRSQGSGPAASRGYSGKQSSYSRGYSGAQSYSRGNGGAQSYSRGQGGGGSQGFSRQSFDRGSFSRGSSGGGSFSGGGRSGGGGFGGRSGGGGFGGRGR